jgi:hypothetical protein
VSVRRARAVVLAALACAPACTAFDGLVPDDAAPAAPAGPALASPAQAATVCGFALDDERVARSLRRSLGLPVSSTSFSACMSWLAGPLPEDRPGFDEQRAVVRAVASALNGAHALEALPVEDLDPSDERCAAGETTRCLPDGRALDCPSGAIFACGSALFADLSSCQGPPGAAACAVAPCTAASATCDDRSVLGVCDPSTHLLTGRACAALGLECPAGTTGPGAACQTARGARACGPGEVAGSTVCDGDLVLVCTDLGTRASVDCAALGGTCAQNEPTKRCRARDEACSPFDATGVDTCDGTRLTTCLAGQLAVVDCAPIGMTCVPAGGGKSGRCGAAR